MTIWSQETGYFFSQELNKNKVKEVVRVCNPTYDSNRLEKLGIQVIVSVKHFMFVDELSSHTSTNTFSGSR